MSALDSLLAKPFTPPSSSEDASSTGSTLSSLTTTPYQAPASPSLSSLVAKPFVPATPAPQKSEPQPYFQGLDTKTGAFMGISDQKDPYSGKPYFAYKLPGAATTTDLTRIAPALDPRIATKQPRSDFENPRMPESASQGIRATEGATADQELDHRMAISLGGSNNDANLKLIPKAVNQAAGVQEGDLSSQVTKGQLSLFAAQNQEAKNKGLPAPWTDEQVAQGNSLWQKIAAAGSQAITGATHLLTEALAGPAERVEAAKQSIAQGSWEPLLKSFNAQMHEGDIIGRDKNGNQLFVIPGLANALSAGFTGDADLAEEGTVNQLAHKEPQAAAKSGPVNPAHVEQYIKQFGNEINTDNARELFPSYRADRSTSAAVHEPASDIAKGAYAKLLDDKQGQGNNTVMFTAGGTGAGKSTALHGLGVDKDAYPIIYDTNSNKFESATGKIEAALNKGYDVEINYVHNSPEQAFENALGRASRMETELGSGRTVPIDEHVNTHLGAQETLPKLMEKYKDDPRVKIHMIDNSGKVASVVDDPLAFLEKNRYNGTHEELQGQLKERLAQAREEGRISERTQSGFEQRGRENGTGTESSPQHGPLAEGKLRPTDSLIDLAHVNKSAEDFYSALTSQEMDRMMGTIDPALGLSQKEASTAFFDHVKAHIEPRDLEAPPVKARGATATSPAATHIRTLLEEKGMPVKGRPAPTSTHDLENNHSDAYTPTITEHNGNVEPPENKGGLRPPEIDWSRGKEIAAIRQSTDTLERTIEKIFPREEATTLNKFLTQADRKNEADKVRFVSALRKETQAYVVDKLGIKPATSASALVQRFGEGRLSLDELKAASPKKWQQIQQAAEYFRGKYNDLIDRWNEARVAAGLKPITKKTNYFRHFMDLSSFAKLYGLDFRESNLPTAISGITEYFRSQAPWTNAAMRRLGNETTDDAVGGFDNYLDSVGRSIFHTDTVQRGRLVEKYLRASAEENTKAGQAMSESGKDKEALPPITLPRFAQTMKGWTDKVSGKQNIFDRSLEAMVGRPALAAMRALTRQFGLNVIGGNLSAAATHIIPINYTLATTDAWAIGRGLMDMTTAPFLEDFTKVGGLSSDFLARRFGKEEISPTLMEKAGAALSAPFHWVDQFISRTTVAAKYFEGITKGLEPAEALKNADNYASRVIGDRSSGNLPPLMSTKTLGWLTQFQIEVNDNLHVLMHDIPYDARGNLPQIAYKMVKFAAFAYLTNQMLTLLKGSGKGLDPIDMGLTLAGLNDEGHDQSLMQRLQLTGGDLLKELPFTSVPTGGQIPALQPLVQAGQATAAGQYGKAIEGVLASFASPIGGGAQLQKSLAAIAAWQQGYVTDAQGHITATVPHTIPELLQGVAFGKSAFPTVQKSNSEISTLDTAIKDQQATGKLKDQQAANMWKQLKGMDKDTAKAQLQQIAAQDPDMATRVLAAAKLDAAGMTKEDILIKTLGVANGQRAGYIVKQMQSMPDDASKKAYLLDLATKKILTAEVLQQVVAQMGQK